MMPRGPGTANRIPLLKRAVVLALNSHVGLDFDAISVSRHLVRPYQDSKKSAEDWTGLASPVESQV